MSPLSVDTTAASRILPEVQEAQCSHAVDVQAMSHVDCSSRAIVLKGVGIVALSCVVGSESRG